MPGRIGLKRANQAVIEAVEGCQTSRQPTIRPRVSGERTLAHKDDGDLVERKR